MKTIKNLILGSLLIFNTVIYSKDIVKETCTVLDIQTKGNYIINSEGAGNLTRGIMNKLDMYAISYDQDVRYTLNKELINEDNRGLNHQCYSLECLENVGKLLKSDKMLSGFIEKTQYIMTVSFREYDVNSKKITRRNSREFKAMNSEVKDMILITLQEMYGQPIDKNMETYLTPYKKSKSNSTQYQETRLNLAGVRIGVVHMIGKNADRLSESEAVGGFDASPTMIQFGYQFEKEYLNKGRLQGLFEFIPTMTGLEQGLLLPSFTILHGLRDNITGIEFAFGPTFGLTTKARGYFDNGNWKLEEEWTDDVNPNPNSIISRIDSRGENKLIGGFFIGAGFSIKSGDFNIPINVFTVMQKNSFRAGISLGFNAKGNSKK